MRIEVHIIEGDGKTSHHSIQESPTQALLFLSMNDREGCVGSLELKTLDLTEAYGILSALETINIKGQNGKET